MIPSGGMYSTVNDIARFLSFQLSAGGPILSKSLLKEMARPQFAAPGQVGGYGLGLWNAASFGAVKLMHSGGGYGFSTDQRWMPAYGLGVVVLCNQQKGGMAATVANLALWHMVAAQLGAVPPTKVLASILEPAIDLAAPQLRRLLGTYRRRGQLVSFELQSDDLQDNLVLIAGGAKQTLSAHSATEFSAKSQRYTFVADRSGAISGVAVSGPDYSNNALELWPLNDTPDDRPGPRRPEWQGFIGSYAGREYGQESLIQVLLKERISLSGRPSGFGLARRHEACGTSVAALLHRRRRVGRIRRGADGARQSALSEKGLTALTPHRYSFARLRPGLSVQ